jgi:hypothetical protein
MDLVNTRLDARDQLCGNCGDRLNDKKGKSDNGGDQRSAYEHDIRATVVPKIPRNLFAYAVDRVENPIHESASGVPAASIGTR